MRHRGGAVMAESALLCDKRCFIRQRRDHCTFSPIQCHALLVLISLVVWQSVYALLSPQPPLTMSDIDEDPVLNGRDEEEESQEPDTQDSKQKHKRRGRRAEENEDEEEEEEEEEEDDDEDDDEEDEEDEGTERGKKRTKVRTSPSLPPHY